MSKTKVKKMLFILSKATIENVYAAFIMANGARMEGIESEIFFTFFGLEAIQKKKLEHLRVATVGNPAMHIPTMLGGLPGMEALATKMMKKEMEKLDMPPVGEFLETELSLGRFCCLDLVCDCIVCLIVFPKNKLDIGNSIG